MARTTAFLRSGGEGLVNGQTLTIGGRSPFRSDQGEMLSSLFYEGLYYLKQKNSAFIGRYKAPCKLQIAHDCYDLAEEDRFDRVHDPHFLFH